MAGYAALQKAFDMTLVSPKGTAPLHQLEAQHIGSCQPAYSTVPCLTSIQELVQTRAVETMCRQKHTLPS